MLYRMVHFSNRISLNMKALSTGLESNNISLISIDKCFIQLKLLLNVTLCDGRQGDPQRRFRIETSTN